MWENHLYTLLNNCWTLCGLRKVYQRELCVREPRCVLCTNAQECKMKGCHYVANLAYGVQFSSLYLTVLSLEVIHIYAYKMLIYLLIVEGLRSDRRCCAKSRVQGLQVQLKPPGLSGFTSHFYLYCTFYFSFSASLGVDMLACEHNCFPGACVVPAPEFSRNPVSRGAELLVRPLLMHVQPALCHQQGSR